MIKYYVLLYNGQWVEIPDTTHAAILFDMGRIVSLGLPKQH